jgi:uncharacterized protein (DUF2132 family)
MIKSDKDPLHGINLQKIVISLQEFYGWDGLAQHVRIRCFTHDPSVSSTLKFLRKTPWARRKVEKLFIYTLEKYG